MDSAGVNLFNTVELLEIILLYLPIRDILLAQRVNAQWRATINCSNRLQRALFIELIVPECQRNSLSEDSSGGPKVFFNPLADKLFWAMSLWQVSLMDVMPETWKYPEASWRQMALTQPPVDAGFRINTFWFRLFNTGSYRLGRIVEELEGEYSHTGGRKNCVTRQDLHIWKRLEIAKDLDES